MLDFDTEVEKQAFQHIFDDLDMLLLRKEQTQNKVTKIMVTLTVMTVILTIAILW